MPVYLSVSPELLKRLADAPLADLRVEAFDGGDRRPSQAEADRRFRDFTRGDLIVHIIETVYAGTQGVSNE